MRTGEASSRCTDLMSCASYCHKPHAVIPPYRVIPSQLPMEQVGLPLILRWCESIAKIPYPFLCSNRSTDSIIITRVDKNFKIEIPSEKILVYRNHGDCTISTIITGRRVLGNYGGWKGGRRGHCTWHSNCISSRLYRSSHEVLSSPQADSNICSCNLIHTARIPSISHHERTSQCWEKRRLWWWTCCKPKSRRIEFDELPNMWLSIHILSWVLSTESSRVRWESSREFSFVLGSFTHTG